MIGEAQTVQALEQTIIHLLQIRDRYDQNTDAWWNCQHAITARTGRLERMKDND